MKTYTRYHKKILYSLVGLGFLLRTFHLAHQSLWFDEIITVHLAQLSLLAGLDGLLAQGIQLTPFFHWVIKLWLFTGTSEWALRFPAVIFSVLTIPLTYQLGKTFFNTTIGLLAAVIITITPFQIWYAQELKIYSILTLSATGSMISFGLLLKEEKKSRFLGLLLFNIIGIYAHYFMLLITTVQFLFILVYFKRYFHLLRNWVFIQILSITTLVPWFGFIFYRQHFFTGIGWIPNPTILDPLLTIWNFTIGYPQNISFFLVFSLIIVGIILLVGITNILHTTPSGTLVLLWFFVPLVIVWILSQGNMSFYVDRYFLIITPALILIIAFGITKISPLYLQRALGVIFVMILLYNTEQIFFDTNHFTKDNWRAMVNILHQKKQPEDKLITCTDGYRLALDYYGFSDIYPKEEHYFVYPNNFDFNKLFSNTTRLWIVNANPRNPQHHLGFSYVPMLNPDNLPADMQTWIKNSPPNLITVSGITAFLFTLQHPIDINKLADWVCK